MSLSQKLHDMALAIETLSGDPSLDPGASSVMNEWAGTLKLWAMAYDGVEAEGEE